MHVHLWPALLATGLLVAGCSTNPFGASDPVRVRVGEPPAHAALPLPDPAAVRELPAAPTGVVTLRDALASAMLRNPELAAIGYEVRAREADAIHAGRLPNPEASLEVENFGGTDGFRGFVGAETTLALSQVVELGGKRIERRRVAEHESRLAGWDYELLRIDVLSQTTANFVGVLAAERRLEMAAEALVLANRVFGAVEERVDAGKSSPVERTTARVEVVQAERDVARSRGALASARLRLAANWGSDEPSFERLSGDFDHIEPPPPLQSLLDRAKNSPDLLRWSAEAALRQAEVDLALSQRVPDATLTGGVRHFNDEDEIALIASVNMPIPIANGNRDSIRSARLRQIRAGILEESSIVQARAALSQAHHALLAAHADVRAVRDEIVPSAELAFAASDEAFAQGKIGAMPLLDAERTLMGARRELTDSLETYHRAVIAVERMLGESLHPLGQIDGSTP